MSMRWLVIILTGIVLSSSGSVFAEFSGSNEYSLDLTKAEEALKKAKWSDPDHIIVTPEGLGWGSRENDKASRDLWLETQPFGIGTSWRPTSSASITVKVDRPGTAGMLYARYSADGKHWTTWQCIEAVKQAVVHGPTQVFRGTLRVPYREMSDYLELA